MDYIIEDTIRFNTKDRSLTHVETSDNIFLAMPGCFLLEYLVKNQGRYSRVINYLMIFSKRMS